MKTVAFFCKNEDREWPNVLPLIVSDKKIKIAVICRFTIKTGNKN